jgi:outer membrane lipoprotein carrier protein
VEYPEVQKMKRFSVFCLLLAIFAGLLLAVSEAPRPYPDSEAKEILQRMSQKVALNRSIRARFVQEHRLVMFDDVLRSEGFLYYQKPGRIRWEFTKPYGSLTILLENGAVEKFDVIAGRPVRIATGSQKVLAEVLTQIMNWQRGNLLSAAEGFRLVLYPGAGYKLVMIPETKGMAKIFLRLEFEIAKESFLVNSVCLWENENDYTMIRFSDQQVDAELSADLFDLKQPQLDQHGEPQ